MTTFVGLGPMPGRDPREAADIVIGECLDGHVTVPMLPARGLGADAVGRTAAMMADLIVDRGARSWRVAERRGRAIARAEDFVHRDFDACEEVWGSTPRLIRLSVLGPWTMAVSVETAAGHLILSDRAAVGYFAESLAAGLQEHIADLRRRFDCRVEVALFEPQLSAISQGLVRAPSMFMGRDGYLPAVGYRELSEVLRLVTEPLRADGMDVTICLPTVEGIAPLALTESGADALSVPRAALQQTAELDFAAAMVGNGLRLELGNVPVHAGDTEEFTGAPLPTSPRQAAEEAAALWDDLGFSRLDMVEKLSLSPAAGFERSTLAETTVQLRAGREAAELIRRAAGDL